MGNASRLDTTVAFARLLTLAVVVFSCAPIAKAQDATASHKTAAVNGATLAYDVGGDGPLIVLIGGGGTLDRRVWDGQMDALSRQYTVLRYDVRGIGGSSRPRASFSHSDDLNALLQSVNRGPAHVVGLSFGAGIAVDFALDHPRMVESLVLAAPGLSSDKDENLESALALAELAREDGLSSVVDTMVQNPFLLAAADDAVRNRVKALYLDNAFVLDSDFALIRLWRPTHPPADQRLASIRVPTLVLVGDRDAAPVHATAESLVSQIGGARRINLEGAGHLLNIDVPEQFNEAILEFLSATRLDAAIVQETVETVADVVDREYFDRDVASRLKAHLAQRLQSGDYSAFASADRLAASLTGHLQAFTADKHLAVTHIRPDDETRASDEARARSRELRARRQNYGVERIQVLPGNVGYLEVTAFYRPNEAREAIEAAMASLRHADALILDMRSNRGGNPGTVALLASYLLDAPGIALFDIVPRYGDATVYVTESVPESHRDGRRPVFVLTSSATFSAGEGLAFILQDHGRAEVIGELTAGAANPGRAYPVSDFFEVVVPNGRVRSAVSGRNWEGTGVIPDIQTTHEAALSAAHRRALQRLLETTVDDDWADALRMELTRLAHP